MLVFAMRIECCQRNVSSVPDNFSGFKFPLNFSLTNAYKFDTLIYLIYPFYNFIQYEYWHKQNVNINGALFPSEGFSTSLSLKMLE